jgi:hypothetical protein
VLFSIDVFSYLTRNIAKPVQKVNFRWLDETPQIYVLIPHWSGCKTCGHSSPQSVSYKALYDFFCRVLMKYKEALQGLLTDDPLRMKALYAVRALKLADGWVGAGFVRDAVWDHLHGYGRKPVSGDVDVVWFDSGHSSPVHDSELEVELRQQSSGFNWSVKNQARMHERNGNTPYFSTENALRYWPETATAVAVRVGQAGLVEVIAPYGLDDLFELRLRPTPHFESEKLNVFRERVCAKLWLERYPLLRLIVPTNPSPP